MSNQIYIISDVHGCYDTLMALIAKLPSDARLVFVGDLIDRGLDSKKVVDFVHKNNYEIVTGNHEHMVVDCYKTNGFADSTCCTSKYGRMWIENGGVECLISYNKNIDAEDAKWMSTLPSYLLFEDYKDEKGRSLVVTHAAALDYLSIYFKILDRYDDLDDISVVDEDMMDYVENHMIWNRTAPMIPQKNYFNVFGHTPISNFIRHNMAYLNSENIVVNLDVGYANIDTGAAYKKNKPFPSGILTALEFPSMRVIQQTNIEA